MRRVKWVVLCVLAAMAGFAGTFGSVVNVVGGAADLALDEARNRLYLVNPGLNQVEVYSIPQRRFLSPIKTGRQPVAAALSRTNKFLYVTAYDSSALDIIDLDTMTLAKTVSLPARPEGVAVGADDRVLITTIGTGTNNSAYTLLIYDPNAIEANNIGNVVITPPPPTPPQLPPPSGRPYLSYRSQLLATRSGDRIIGLNINGNNRVVFVYEVASASVLRSRQVGGISTVLSVSPDGSRFMAGLSLFDTDTLAVLAQQNAANAPFTFPSTPAANFSLQQNQGGSVFSPDGSVLYTAFNIAPDQNPPARPNISRLLLNEPDNLLVRLGLELPENLAGKIISNSEGSTLYALSESGFMVLPIATLPQYPIAMPEGSVIMLTNDQCGVLAQNRTASVNIRNLGSGRLTATPQLLQLPQTGPQGLGGQGGSGGGAPGGGIVIIVPPGPGGGAGTAIPLPGQRTPATPQQQTAVVQYAPRVTARQTPGGPVFEFSFNPNAARSLGTMAPPATLLIQSPEAINIPSTIRVYQNNRDSEARADVIPVEVGTAPLEGLVDMAVDPLRQRLYIANSGMNRVEIYDMRQRQFLTPVKVGQLPRSLAMSPDGNTLYVANTGGESISIIDLAKNELTGRVKFPPIPFNASAGIVTPSVLAAGLSGLQVVMSNGTLWQVIGDNAVPRTISPMVGRSTIPAPRSMAATPGGEYILLLSGDGFVYLYDAMQDEYVMGRQIFSRAAGGTAAGGATALQGLYGAIAAGPRGQYYVLNGLILNPALTPVGSIDSVAAGQAQSILRQVAALAAVGTTTFARFTQPVRASANALVTDPPVVEIVDVNTGNTLRRATAVEGPMASTVGAAPAMQGINGRTMAIDAAGSTAYILTTSGLSVVPLEVATPADRPLVNQNGVVSVASYLPNVAPGALVGLFGRNLGTLEAAGALPLPTILGGTCVTLNNQPLPLLMTSTGQVNAQVPPELAPGRYQLVVRSISQKAASNPYQLNVAKFAPAVFVDPVSQQAAIFHADGRPVSRQDPARRDERLVLYATGLGATRGGKVVAGVGAPSSPLAETEDVKVFFGDPRYRQAEMIVEWSGLAPGMVGLYQINLYVPGDRMHGDELPVTIRVGGVDSPNTGPVPPLVAVH